MLEDTLIIFSADHGEELGGMAECSPTDVPCTGNWCTSRLSGLPDRLRPREDDQPVQ